MTGESKRKAANGGGRVTGNGEIVEDKKPKVEKMGPDDIKRMMENAKRDLEKRKAEKGIVTTNPINPNMSVAERLAEAKARLAANPVMMPIGPMAQDSAAQDTKPVSVYIDPHGRTVDKATGRVVNIPSYTPTLKANLRAKGGAIVKAEPTVKVKQQPAAQSQVSSAVIKQQPVAVSSASFFDPRVGEKSSNRFKRTLNFNEKGKYEQLGNQMRAKAQLEKLQSEIGDISKRTGVESAARLAQFSKEAETDYTPEIEWWDHVLLLLDPSYDDVEDQESLIPRLRGMSNLIEHPITADPPDKDDRVITVPLYLTKKERKKVRRQQRRSVLKEEQEKVRIGLKPPPEPKVRIANMMRVMAQDHILDPTTVEARVRAQMAKRQREHEHQNQKRKLTDEQRAKKMIKKLTDDTRVEVDVTVYKLKDLANPSIKFKIEMNIKQLHMTGIVVLYKDCNVVVVEGGPKQQKMFKRLMMNRIKFHEDVNKKTGVVNEVKLVWAGKVRDRSFGEIQFKQCISEQAARAIFKQKDIESYWDMSFTTTLLGDKLETQ